MSLLISSLKLPLKLLVSLVGSKKKRLKKTERKQKQLAHVRNFDPTRLNNRSWQKSIGKDKKKRNKKKKILN